MVRPLLEDVVPQELESVAGLRSARISVDPTNQGLPLQLGDVLLGLPLPDANLPPKGAHSGIAAAVMTCVPGQTSPGQLRSGAQPAAANKTLRDEDPGEHPVRIERVTLLKTELRRGLVRAPYLHDCFLRWLLQKRARRFGRACRRGTQEIDSVLCQRFGDLDITLERFGDQFGEPDCRRQALPVYLEVVSSLEAIVEDLKSLPPEKLEAAADFIRQLKPISPEERQAVLDRTFGCLSKEEADELQRVVEEGCELVNEHGW
jgi:hypothetical protein